MSLAHSFCLQGPFDHKALAKELMALPHDEAEKRVRRTSVELHVNSQTSSNAVRLAPAGL